MDIFGFEWEGYMNKIKNNWLDTVEKNDTVLIPGDVSWATYLDKTIADFDFLESLPGNKIIIKGNHDYWWETVSKVKRVLTENKIKTIRILHNDSFEIDNASVYGTRGWILKNSANFSQHDKKIYYREVERLKLSIRSGKERKDYKIVMLHYPPISPTNKENEFTQICDEHEIDICIFGHLHNLNSFEEYNCIIRKTQYKLVSGDSLNFIPFKIPNI